MWLPSLWLRGGSILAGDRKLENGGSADLLRPSHGPPFPAPRTGPRYESSYASVSSAAAFLGPPHGVAVEIRVSLPWRTADNHRDGTVVLDEGETHVASSTRPRSRPPSPAQMAPLR